MCVFFTNTFFIKVGEKIEFVQTVERHNSERSNVLNIILKLVFTYKYRMTLLLCFFFFVFRVFSWGLIGMGGRS